MMDSWEEAVCPKCGSDELLAGCGTIDLEPVEYWYCVDCNAAGELIEDDLQVLLVY